MPSEDFYLRRATIRTLLRHAFMRAATLSFKGQDTFQDPYTIVQTCYVAETAERKRLYKASEDTCLSTVRYGKLLRYTSAHLQGKIGEKLKNMGIARKL